MLVLENITKDKIIDLVFWQANNIFPVDTEFQFKKIVRENLDFTLLRLATCINSIKYWKPNSFDYLHSSQYCIFLYFLANTIWKNTSNTEICTRIFILNKALNGIDLFYEIEMPPHFFIAHSAGIVLAKAKYGDYFVLHQNVTVGKNFGHAPEIGERVILFPGSLVAGNSVIGADSVVAAGVSVVNKNIPSNSIVYSADGGVTVTQKKRSILSDIFRLKDE